MHTIVARTRADNELSLNSRVGGVDRTLTLVQHCQTVHLFNDPRTVRANRFDTDI